MDIIKAVKLIYPDINGGFTYWYSKPEGGEWENPIDGLVWENKEYERPTWEQIEQALVTVNLESAKLTKIKICKNYLSSTDWYLMRELDRPSSYPQEIRNNREFARASINNIEDCQTLEELEQININFL